MSRGASADATAENHLKQQENSLIRQLATPIQRSGMSAAGQHLQGCLRRLMMMQRSRIEIRLASQGEQKPLDPYRVTLLNIHLNSYYLNLLGGLDNLAWATTYELSLLAEIDEAAPDVRKFCSLVSPRFVGAIRKRSEAFADLVVESRSWITDVKRFRDPAAHRLPLAIVRGIMTEEEGRLHIELSKQSIEALLDDRWEDSIRLQGEADNLGRFVPLLEGPRSPDQGIYIVPNQMTADQRQFAQFTHDYLRHLAQVAA